MQENPSVPESPSSGELAHNYSDAHLSMNALNMTAGHDSVLAAEIQENNSVSQNVLVCKQNQIEIKI
ncbi:unnamed protein product [Leptosia nina]|uniref:Uncharacterized protein n=1 Tax=Leptosia nina TaxID=320188 RepID=A0AAV1IZD0_9NEOP